SRTQASTTEIQEMIERLQTGAGQAVTVMEQGRSQAQESVGMAAEAGNSLDQITQAVSAIKDMNTQIASAAEEQSAVSQEVDRNLINTTQAVEGIAAGSTQINHAASELAQLAAEQQERVGRFKF
ncbi:methyl-accepting chemotaxis protein, partial [Marichromatium gracile]|uniref:methyl-accepting chemotaxis protein n=1 Tax=Marichromatium gracile TaxID=1048 RepID=UPI001F365337